MFSYTNMQVLELINLIVPVVAFITTVLWFFFVAVLAMTLVTLPVVVIGTKCGYDCTRNDNLGGKICDVVSGITFWATFIALFML